MVLFENEREKCSNFYKIDQYFFMSAMPKISLLGFQHYKPENPLANSVDPDEMARMFEVIKWIYSVFLLIFYNLNFQDNTPFKHK